MLFERTFSLSRSEYVAGMRAVVADLGRNRSHASRRIWELLVLLLVAGLVTDLLFPDSFTPTMVTLFVLYFVGISVAPMMRTRDLGVSYDERLMRNIHVRLDDAGVMQRDPLRERRWDWPGVIKLHELDFGLVFQLAGYDLVCMPNRLWTSTDERSKFSWEVRKWIQANSPSSTPEPQRDRSIGLGAERTFAVSMIGLYALGPLIILGVIFVLSLYKGQSLALTLTLFGMVFAASCFVAFGLMRASGGAFDRVEQRLPRLAKAIATAILWAVPAWFLISQLWDRWVK